MTEHEFKSVEDVLARYRPSEAPDELLRSVQQAVLRRRRRTWRELLIAELSAVAEALLGLSIRGLATATTVIALLLIASKGY